MLNYRHPIPRGSWLGCLTTSTATSVFPFKASREVAPLTSKRIKEKYKWQNRNPTVLNSTCGLHCPSDCSSHLWIQICATPLGSQLLPFLNFRVTEGGQAWKAILLMIVYNVFWDVFYGRICSYTNWKETEWELFQGRGKQSEHQQASLWQRALWFICFLYV